PAEDRERFKRWSDDTVSATAMGGSSQEEMCEYFLWMIEQRRKQPEPDLISALLAAQIDGEHLSPEELLAFCIFLLIAGNETTRYLLGNAVLCFDEHPEALEQVQAEPALLPEAIEEVLRYRSPVKM